MSTPDTNAPHANAPDALLLHIDWTRCDGRGLCTELLASRLGRDEWGYPVAAHQPAATRSDVELGPADRAAALDAVALCPRQALKMLAR